MENNTRKEVKVAQSCLTLCNPMDYTVHRILHSSRDLPNSGIELRSPALQVDSSPAEPPDKPKNTGVGSLSLLQGIFPTWELNWGPLHCRQILYQLGHKGSPRTLEWVVYPFSRGSSLPRNQTRVSYIVGGFFTNWVIREASLHIRSLTLDKSLNQSAHFPHL